MGVGGMSAGGMNVDRIHTAGVTWREVPGIYKARLRRLWQVLRLSLLAAIIVLATVVMLPLIFGFALFSGHFILTALGVFVVLLVSGRLYWMSLKLAFNLGKRR